MRNIFFLLILNYIITNVLKISFPKLSAIKVNSNSGKDIKTPIKNEMLITLKKF